MNTPPNSLRTAAAGVGFLLLLAAVAGWPMWTGGARWYLDNPAHLAETLERSGAGWRGWSDLAFCGFPLGQWHSPTAYGLLVTAMRVGAPATATYTAALAAAFLLPPLLLFAAARPRNGTARAALLAAVLMLQPPALVGIASAWGGMWTFYLAAGGLFWLMRRWATGMGTVIGDAALVGAIGLAHLFVFAAVPLLAGLRIALALRQGPAARRAAVMGACGACLLGALAAAAYWLPAVLTPTGTGWTPQNLSPGRVLWAFVAPADLQRLTSAAPIAWREAWQPGVLPMLALLGLGVAGGRDRTGRLGLAFAAAVLAVLLLLPVLPPDAGRAWGPVSWRLLYLARLGLVWSAVGAWTTTPATRETRAPPFRLAAGAALLLALGWWVAAPLRAAVRDPDRTLEREVERLWAAIRAAAAPDDPGRLYLQDTYGHPDLPAGLPRHSHALAYTAAATGARQLGAYYGLAPEATAAWTAGEFGRLCGIAWNESGATSRVEERLRRGHCTRVVVAGRTWADLLAGRPGWVLEYQSGWFTMFRLEGAARGGVEVLAGDVRATLRRPQPDATRVDIAAAGPGGSLRVAQAWHPDWKADVPAGVRAGSDATGLWRLDNLPAGASTLDLRYRPPAWPRWLSAGAWVGLAAAAAAARRRALR